MSHSRSSRALLAYLVILALLLLAVQPALADSTNPPPPGGPTQAMLDKIVKTASATSLVPGDTVTYTIHLEIGWGSGVSANVKDPLPPGLEYVADSADHGGVFDTATRTLKWTGIAVAVGTSVDLTYAMKYTTAVPRPTPVTNVATITWNSFMLQRAAWVTLMPNATSPSPLLGSFKSAEPRMLGPAEKVTYTIRLVNSSASALTATVSDPLPGALTYVDGSASNSGVYDSSTRTITWSDVAVPAAGTTPVALTFQAQAPATIPASTRPQVVTNTASITSGTTTLKRSADVLLVTQTASPLAGSFKSASRRDVTPGQSFSYTIQLHNSGSTTLTVGVSDPLPAQVSYVAASANAEGVYDETTRTITWSNLTVPAGTSVELTFSVTAASDAITAPVRIVNTASITSDSETLTRSAVVGLVPTLSGDRQPPQVQSLTIGTQDVLTSGAVALHIAATDNVAVTQMYLKEWVLSTETRPHWQEVATSGWIDYKADVDWTLSEQNGTHFIGVWVADAAKNKSRLTPAAIDFASLVLPGAALAKDGLIPYMVYFPAGVDVSASLNVLSGTANLHVWLPGSMFGPDYSGVTTTGSVQSASFTTKVAGVYLFLVSASADATFDLTLTPGGGPRVPVNVTPWPDTADSGLSTGTTGTAGDASSVDSLSANPILPESGQDPLNVSTDPSGPYYGVFVPLINQ